MNAIQESFDYFKENLIYLSMEDLRNLEDPEFSLLKEVIFKGDLDPLLKILILFDVKIDILLNEDFETYYDLNTGAKSGIWAFPYEDGSGFKLKMRYGATDSAYDLQDFASSCYSCLHGRSYVNCAWSNILELFGYSVEKQAIC